MNKHPFVSGLIAGLIAAVLLVVMTLLIFPELIYIYRSVNKFFLE